MKVAPCSSYAPPTLSALAASEGAAPKPALPHSAGGGEVVWTKSAKQCRPVNVRYALYTLRLQNPKQKRCTRYIQWIMPHQ